MHARQTSYHGAQSPTCNSHSHECRTNLFDSIGTELLYLKDSIKAESAPETTQAAIGIESNFPHNSGRLLVCKKGRREGELETYTFLPSVLIITDTGSPFFM